MIVGCIWLAGAVLTFACLGKLGVSPSDRYLMSALWWYTWPCYLTHKK